MAHLTVLGKRRVVRAVDYQVPLDAKLAFSQDVLKIVIPLVTLKDPQNPIPPADTSTDTTTTT